MDYNIWMPEHTSEANQEGKLAGYCANVDCGCMLIKGETHCPKCGGTRTTSRAPKERSRIYGKGATTSAMGNPNKILNRC